MQQIEITAHEAGQRFSKMLEKYLNEAPKSFIYKMLRKKNITLNGKKATGNEKLKTGDLVRLFLADETICRFSRREKPAAAQRLKIIYEDEQVLFINKPVGLLSQKAAPTDISVVECIIAYLFNSGQLTETKLRSFRPGICNRLDRNTSGLVAAGKTVTGLQEMAKLFSKRTLKKYYLCVVRGVVSEAEYISGYLIKNEKTNQVSVSRKQTAGSLPIETEYVPLAAGKDYTVLEVHLITGRTHQIRAHLASVGHPLAGDYKYGCRAANEQLKQLYGLGSQLLHAYRIELPQECGALKQLSGRVFTARPPELFKKIAKDVTDGNLEF